MEQIDKEILKVQNGLKAAADAISEIAKQPAIIPEPADRSISGNKINAGRITNFSSTGIRDQSTDFVLTVSDNGITVNTANINNINNDVSVNGNLTVDGEITANRLHVNELSSDIRNERTSPLEFRADNGNVANKGLLWTGQGTTKQFTFQLSPDRLFSSESIDINNDKNYMIGRTEVLSADTLGPTVINSSLRSVGTLQNLSTIGNVNIDNYVFWDSDSMRLGIGTESPNGMLSIKNLEHEFTVDYTDDLQYKVGTWTTTGLKIITDNTDRITIDPLGQITLKDKVCIEGKLGIGVRNDNEADLATAGPIKFQNKKFEVGRSIPNAGPYNQGDIVWNDDPQPTGYVGWICIRSGNPGDWKPFGLISS